MSVTKTELANTKKRFDEHKRMLAEAGIRMDDELILAEAVGEQVGGFDERQCLLILEENSDPSLFSGGLSGCLRQLSERVLFVRLLEEVAPNDTAACT